MPVTTFAVKESLQSIQIFEALLRAKKILLYYVGKLEWHFPDVDMELGFNWEYELGIYKCSFLLR